MADISSSPAIGSPTGLYPQPPSQQGALSSNPGQLIDLMRGITQNEMLQRELKARAAIGNAYQGALQPDNNFDMPSFMGAIRSNPDAAWLAGEAIPHVLGIAKAQSENLFTQNQAATNLLGSLPKNATDDQIRQVQASLSRVFKGQNTALIEGWANYIKGLHGKARADAIALAQTGAIGPAGTAKLVEAPPLPGGAPATQPLGERIFAGGTQPIGQPIGEEIEQQEASKAAAVLEATGGTTPQYHADLQNLRELNKKASLAGPTAEWEKRLNQLGSRYGIKVTLTGDELQAAEEFAKIANQVSLRQSTTFHGSDMGLHTTIEANPNLAQSQAGREAIIDRLEGTQDAIDRTRQLWHDARDRGAPVNSHFRFLERTSKIIDPRVFQFNRMSRDNQQKFLGDMDPSDLPEFETRYRDAIKRGWVKPLKGQKPQQ